MVMVVMVVVMVILVVRVVVAAIAILVVIAGMIVAVVVIFHPLVLANGRNGRLCWSFVVRQRSVIGVSIWKKTHCLLNISAG